MPADSSHSPFDSALETIPNLAWLPWVGTNYENLPERERVLIVAESQAYYDDHPPGHCPVENERLADRTLARAMVTMELIRKKMIVKHRSQTLIALNRLLYKPKDRSKFWSNLTLHHFVQRPHWCHGPIPELPNDNDLSNGWEILVRVVEVLKPLQILVIGLEPSYGFNSFMEERGGPFTPVASKSPFHRRASFECGEDTCVVHFIKNCGSSFRPALWRRHLERTADSVMSRFRVFAGRNGLMQNGDYLHVLGTVLTPFDLVRGEMDRLELELLRLARAVSDFAEVGEPAVAYLRVTDAMMGRAAADLAKKHRIGNDVFVLCDQVVGDNHRDLVRQMRVEVFNWVREMRYDGPDWEPSLAEIGRKVAAKQLEVRIRQYHDGLVPRTRSPYLEFCQFYGTVALARRSR